MLHMIGIIQDLNRKSDLAIYSPSNMTSYHEISFEDLMPKGLNKLAYLVNIMSADALAP